MTVKLEKVLAVRLIDTKFSFGQSQPCEMSSRPIKKGSSASRVTRRRGLKGRGSAKARRTFRVQMCTSQLIHFRNALYRRSRRTLSRRACAASSRDGVMGAFLTGLHPCTYVYRHTSKKAQMSDGTITEKCDFVKTTDPLHYMKFGYSRASATTLVRTRVCPGTQFSQMNSLKRRYFVIFSRPKTTTSLGFVLLPQTFLTFMDIQYDKRTGTSS